MRPLRRRPVDLAVSAAIVVALVIAATAAWYFSSARRTTLTPATATPSAQPYPAGVPASLRQLWTARSADTRSPQITDAVVVTGDDRTVAGRDPATGRVLWSYRRSLPLCGVLAAWSPSTPTALSAYRNSRGCGEVTAIDASKGVRRFTRSSDADTAVTLQSDGGYVLSLGATRLETWGSNLVRGIEYGRVDARVKPDRGPHDGSGCRISSGMTSGDRVALVEHCTGDAGYRLTVVGAVVDKDEKISLYGTTVITSGTAFAPPVVVAMSESAVAVYDGGANSPEPTPPSIRAFDSDGNETGRHRVPGGPELPRGEVSTDAEGLATVWTGSATVAIDTTTMRPTFTVPDTRGPGVSVDGRMLIPDARGYLVVDAATGHRIGDLPVPREPGTDAPIVPALIGAQVVEQRGPTITAYGPATPR
ncbi:hypothetical protein [Gordonia sp. (in: high G+C Gram-positive bacteria)]|uniref:Rv3212 family protein n=1 Tax=Gordonia sp. (in: high G+C Gram-positive bacteria) TaxID=84139 RepID=UPI0039E6E9EC